MIVRIPKKEYNIVRSDRGKRIRVKGQKQTYSEGTEYPDRPIAYEEAEEE